jgi:transcriptional regulator with XRE-family HTH domain
MKKEYKESKLGRLLKERGIPQVKFAEMLYEKTGYLIQPTNLSNICSGYREIVKLDTAKKFAETLDVTIDDVVGQANDEGND